MNSLSLHKRSRRGSLPFKKRPFRLVQQQQASVVVVCGKDGRHNIGTASVAVDLKHAFPRTMLNANPAEHPVTDSTMMKEDDPFAALNLIAIAASTAAASATASSSADSLMSTASTASSLSPSSPSPVLPAHRNSSRTRLVTLSTRFSALASPGGRSVHHDEDEDVMFPRVVLVSDGQENATTQRSRQELVDDLDSAVVTAVSLSLTPSLLSPTAVSKKRILLRAAAVQPEDLPKSMVELPTQNTNTATPLTSPLPGGCHGRTSRTHFYCRRRPCYKGSNYCKLHYQHYVLTGSASFTGILCRETSLGSNSTNSSADWAMDEAATEQQQQQQPTQNRRYTGRSGEQRCLATTTRGRPCAYVAASGHNKYCNLHADYDCNPSPRRGGGAGSGALSSSSASEAHVQVNNLEAKDSMNKRQSSGGSATGSKTGGGSRPSLTFRPSSSLVSVASSSLDSSPSSSTVSKPKPGGKRDRNSDTADSTTATDNFLGHNKKRCTNAKLAKKHADSPFPLLSMFSTDQWMHKKVSISTGPLAGSVGVVEKWSNGWVSVRVPGVGLHNRRSFELYLVQEEEPSDGEDAAADAVVLDADEQKRALLRTVSREAASPSPLAMTDSISPSSNNKKMVTTSNRRLSAGSSSPNEIPQSPCPTRHVADVLRTPVSQHVVTNLVPKVTPCLPKMPQKDVPLVQSLLLAQEGNGRMDLLFGTAALERSRRTVRKPTLYQDTEMLEKKQGGRNNSDAYQHIPFKKRVTGSSPHTADVTGKVDG